MTAPAPPRPQAPRPEPTARTIGPLPLSGVVVLEVGLAIGLLLLAADTGLLPVAAAVALGSLLLAAGRWGGRPLGDWVPVAAGFRTRSRTRELPAVDSPTGDRRAAVLRLVAPDLEIGTAAGHDRTAIAVLRDRDEWATVLAVPPGPALLASASPDTGLSLPVLAGCLEDRGVRLSRIRVLWHSFPSAAALPAAAPAARSYREVLGPLPTAARRTTWVTVGINPARTADAVAERGGGEIGVRRALVGATARVRRALADSGAAAVPLDEDGVLRAGVVALDLGSAIAAGSAVTWRESWDHVGLGGIGHRSYAVTGLPGHLAPTSLEGLTALHARSVTVALDLARHDATGTVRLSGLIRVSAQGIGDLDLADRQLRAAAAAAGITLEALTGRHGAGLTATVPLVGRS